MRLLNDPYSLWCDVILKALCQFTTDKVWLYVGQRESTLNTMHLGHSKQFGFDFHLQGFLVVSMKTELVLISASAHACVVSISSSPLLMILPMGYSLWLWPTHKIKHSFGILKYMYGTSFFHSYISEVLCSGHSVLMATVKHI